MAGDTPSVDSPKQLTVDTLSAPPLHVRLAAAAPLFLAAFGFAAARHSLAIGAVSAALALSVLLGAIVVAGRRGRVALSFSGDEVVFTGIWRRQRVAARDLATAEVVGVRLRRVGSPAKLWLLSFGDGRCWLSLASRAWPQAQLEALSDAAGIARPEPHVPCILTGAELRRQHPGAISMPVMQLAQHPC